MPERTNGQLDRRTVLKGIGIGAVGIGGAVGAVSAHHVQELRGLEGIPGTVAAGESFSFTVLWTSGHGGQACFVAAIGTGDGNWTEIGRATDTASEVDEKKETQVQATIPEDTEPGEYMLRVSATEEESCPTPGETGETGRFFVEAVDTNIEIACVANSKGAENADPPGHEKDEGDPGGGAHDSDEDGDKPGERKGHCKFD